MAVFETTSTGAFSCRALLGAEPFLPRAGAAYESQPFLDSPGRLLVSILVLGAFLRLIVLGRDSLWFDELYVVMINGFPLGDMIREVLAAAHLPLYHLTLRVWLLAGEK
ncbi:MAG: hypothetical protein ACYCW5_03655 [Thermoleophilia bacterium]